MQFPFKLFQALSISEVIYLEICVSYFEVVMIISFDEIFFLLISALRTLKQERQSGDSL